MQDHTDDTLRVRQMMTVRALSVEPDTTLEQAIRAMVLHGFRHLPVVRGGEVVALVSDRNIRIMVNELVEPGDRRRYLAHTSVMAHATRPVITVGPDATASAAARLFVKHHIGCLPVVDGGGQLVGILTQTDLLIWLARVMDSPPGRGQEITAPLDGAA